MIWDEFLRHFCFCDEEDSGLSDEVHQAKKNFLEKFKTASYISHFFNYINYLVLLVIADGLSFKVFVSQSYVFIYNRIKLICGKICLINER